MPSTRFELAISEIDRLLTYTLEHTVTAIEGSLLT
jgi:hypothetical protein